MYAGVTVNHTGRDSPGMAPPVCRIPLCQSSPVHRCNCGSLPGLSWDGATSMQNTPFVRVFLYTSVTVDHTRTLLGRHHQRAGTPFVIPVHGCNWTIQGLYWDGTAHVQDTLCQSIPVCCSNCGPYQDSPGLAQPARRIPLCQSIPVCRSNCRPYRDSLRMAPSACRIPPLSEYPCIPE